ncbi:hypothetical protein RP20_CCG018635 [Aedes albopictus]|nr:hypothetical protein RP20_CCG018635 [Aedes albopictus]
MAGLQQWNFCPNCGYPQQPLVEGPLPPADQTPQRRTRRKRGRSRRKQQQNEDAAQEQGEEPRVGK